MMHLDIDRRDLSFLFRCSHVTEFRTDSNILTKAHLRNQSLRPHQMLHKLRIEVNIHFHLVVIQKTLIGLVNCSLNDPTHTGATSSCST